MRPLDFRWTSAEGAPRNGRSGAGARRRETPSPSLIDTLLPVGKASLAAFAGKRWGVAPLEAAVALDLTTEAAVAAALAARLGAECVDAADKDYAVAADPANWARIVARGAVFIDRRVGGKALLLAPGARSAERIARQSAAALGYGLPVIVTTPAAFSALIRRWARPAWVTGALETLAAEEPASSAADRRIMRRAAAAALGLPVAVGAALLAGPSWLSAAVGLLIGLGILAWIAVRVAAAVMAPSALPLRPLSDAELPVYTVLVPLHRETTVVRGLMAALSRLDYPRAKLDIKLLLEEDDPETLAAIRALPANAAVEVLVLPPDGPRTKPKALMMALPLARGRLVVVYDAEDRPDRRQLREAAETFAAADARLGCLQAPLSVVNARDGLLARFFAIEYDALFRVLLPALARLDLPVPLGGSSNHFRIEALTQSLAWDPYNVTEDADLGFRLARNGWRVGTIASPTEEEAPYHWRAWLGQRSRWFKGWLQTCAVLAREPRRVGAEMGLRGCLAVAVTIMGALGSALIHLVCVAAFAVSLLVHGPGWWTALAVPVAVLGYAGSVFHALTGLRRAERGDLRAWTLLMPLSWLAMGVAALRAGLDLWVRPFHWEKTRHGLGSCDPGWLPAEQVAPASVADSLVAPVEGELRRRIREVVAVSEEIRLSGRTSAEVALPALRRTRERLAAMGASGEDLLPLDRHCAAWAAAASGS